MDLAKLRAQLIEHEGCRLTVYADTVGKLTVGVGHNLSDKGISQTVSDLLLEEDIAESERGLRDALPWFDLLDEVRQRVLIDMCFNMGLAGLLGFRNTLQAVQERRFEDAARGMLASRWASQVGRRAVRLAAMMRTGSDQVLV